MTLTGHVERGSVAWLSVHPTRGHEQNGWRSGVDTTHSRVPFTELSGVVLTDQAKFLDLNERNAVVIGKVDVHLYMPPRESIACM